MQEADIEEGLCVSVFFFTIALLIHLGMCSTLQTARHRHYLSMSLVGPLTIAATANMQGSHSGKRKHPSQLAKKYCTINEVPAPPFMI